MSATGMMPPVGKRVRAYFAPVDRVAHKPTLFDAAQSGSFAVDAPPSPWVDLGWIENFTRKSGTVITAVRAGAPATTKMQGRSEVDATVTFAFQQWGKLQLSLAAGTQQMNVLASGPDGNVVSAVPVLAGSTANSLNVGVSAAPAFLVGSVVAADVDTSAGQMGFVGSGVSGAYLRTSVTDVDYVRRVTLNVGRVAAVSGGALSLEAPLPAGMPTAAMKISPVMGFCDREGSSFFQEWSALFVCEGQQGERVVWHYPRLQSMQGIAEEGAKSAGGYEVLRLAGAFRALPVVDPVDGETVVCFRSYLPA